MKHGALKEAEGRLEITWLARPDGADGSSLVLDWREHGVQNVQKPSRRGFGTELIERALQFTLRATTALTFREGGISCHIELPLSPPTPDK